jgi:hypothetical protein
VIKLRKYKKQKKVPTQEVIEWILNTKFENQWRGIESTANNDWFSSKSIVLHYTVFFKDPAIFDLLSETIGQENFEEYEKPIDKQHTEQMAREKVITRSQLFFKKYRIAFRIPVRRTRGRTGFTTSHITQMQEWCEDQFGPQINNDDRYRIQRWTNGTFYFADPKDAILFKMTWSDNIGSSERVVLVSELEAARASKEGD